MNEQVNMVCFCLLWAFLFGVLSSKWLVCKQRDKNEFSRRTVTWTWILAASGGWILPDILDNLFTLGIFIFIYQGGSSCLVFLLLLPSAKTSPSPGLRHMIRRQMFIKFYMKLKCMDSLATVEISGFQCRFVSKEQLAQFLYQTREVQTLLPISA